MTSVSYLHARRRIFGRRQRQAYLPQASLFILVTLVILAIWFSPSLSSNSIADTSDPLLDLTTVRTGSTYGELCTRENDIRSQKWTLAILIPGVVFLFVGLAIITDDYFVSALERICERLSLSEDVAGATFMAAGSSTPEFFASMIGVFVTKDTVGVGTIVGSAVFNILVIIGLSAALAGATLALDWRPLARDSFFYTISIIELLIFVVGITPGYIDWWEGLILVATYAIYVLFMAFGNRPYMRWTGKLYKSSDRDLLDIEMGGTEAVTDTHLVSEILSEPKRVAEREPTDTTALARSASQKPNYRALNPRSKFRTLQFAVIAANRLSSSSENSEDIDEVDDSEEGIAQGTIIGVERPGSILGWLFFPMTVFWRLLFRFVIVDCASDEKAHLWWLTFLTSIVLISGISYLMVEAARLAGCLIGIPATAMGLTVLAAGTSVPDALASISVARDGAADMAVSNAIGSNVFDILLGLGFPWFIGAITREIEIPTDPLTIVVVPIVILFSILILLVAILVLLKWQLRPLLGYILFTMYGVFVLYTLLDVYVFEFSTE